MLVINSIMKKLELLLTPNLYYLRFSNDKTLKNMNLKEKYQKNFIAFQKKLDVKKLVLVILKELKIILKNFI